MSPLIDQQAQRLWRIYDKYERDEVPRLLWVDEKLWYDLFADRRYLAGSVDYVLRKNMARTIWVSQDKMERELLMQMVTPQISFIAEELELSETQVDRLALLVNQDVYKKHQLLRTTFNDLDPDQFFARLRSVTAATEAKIQKILFSDQLTYYRRLSNEAFEQKSTKIASVPAVAPVHNRAG